MKLTIKSIVFLVILIISACNKQSNTGLQIKVVNSTNDPVPGASVTLYPTQKDLTAGTNTYDVQYSDNSGVVNFSIGDISVLYYNVFRSQDCASNVFSNTRTGVLVSGQLNLETTTLYQVGNLTIKNTSQDDYDVTINGKAWKTVNANASITSVVKADTYTIHVKQVSGSSGTPIEKDYNVNVVSCGTQSLSFP